MPKRTNLDKILEESRSNPDLLLKLDPDKAKDNPAAQAAILEAYKKVQERNAQRRALEKEGLSPEEIEARLAPPPTVAYVPPPPSVPPPTGKRRSSSPPSVDLSKPAGPLPEWTATRQKPYRDPWLLYDQPQPTGPPPPTEEDKAYEEKEELEAKPSFSGFVGSLSRLDLAKLICALAFLAFLVYKYLVAYYNSPPAT